MKRLNHSIVAAYALLATASVSPAITVYVDQRYGPGGNGTATAPYNTIRAAISDTSSDTIIVLPGTYNENLVISKSLKLYGYDGPLTTRINGAAGGDTIYVMPNLDVWIEGLNISSGVNGVYFATSGALHLRNCVICGNSANGICVDRGSGSSAVPELYVYNCILVSNGGSGLLWGKNDWKPTVTVLNTICIGNSRYGIEQGNGAVYRGTISLDYNDYADNALGQYNGNIGPGQAFSAGAHSLSIAPAFVGGAANLCNQDFRLLPTSPCKDSGHPGIGFLDPDGTRGDMGAFGGPGAQNFYTNPNDGPMIRSVTIDQGMVPKGSTFTIRATGAVR